jgi:hypothetical protein
MTNDEIFNIVIISIAILLFVLFVALSILKLFLYIKMKQDGEKIKTVSKGYIILGVITEIFFVVLIVVYLIDLFNKVTDSPFPMLGVAYFPFWFFLSGCFIGNKSVVIRTKRYFYSDIVKIEITSSAYKFTISDGTVKKTCVVYGRKKLDEELKRVLPKLTASL